MSTGKIRFDSMREVSAWARRTGGAALSSLWTGLDFPRNPPPTPKPLSPAATRLRNRKTRPTKNSDIVEWKTQRCIEEKGCWATFKCEEVAEETKGHSWRRRYILGCKSPDCEPCQGAYATKRAREAWGRPDADPEGTTGAMRFLNAANKVVWWYIVCPLPRQLRPFVTQDRIKILRDSFWRQFQSWAMARQGLENQDLQMGAFEVMHPEGDKEEDGEKQFHPHLNFIVPAMAFGTYKAPDGMKYEGKRLKHLLFKRELEELRTMWKNAIYAAFGLHECVLARECEFCAELDNDYKRGVEIPEKAVIYISYRGKPGPTYDADTGAIWNKSMNQALREQKHCLKYNFRSFPGWSAWTRRIIRYGYLASRKIGQFRAAWEEWEPEPYSEPLSCKCGGSIEVETDDPLAEVYCQDATGPQLLEEVRDLWSFHPGSLPDPGGGSSEGEYVPDLHVAGI